MVRKSISRFLASFSPYQSNKFFPRNDSLGPFKQSNEHCTCLLAQVLVKLAVSVQFASSAVQ